MNFLDYYKLRFSRIFAYNSTKWYMVIAKTLCIIVGLPLFVVLIPIDLLFFLVYALLGWIPFLGLFILFICKALSFVWSIGYYIAILPDIKQYIKEDNEAALAEKEAETAQEDGSQQILNYQIGDAQDDADTTVETDGNQIQDAESKEDEE